MKIKEHWCSGCGYARYVGGTTIFVCEKKDKICIKKNKGKETYAHTK